MHKKRGHPKMTTGTDMYGEKVRPIPRDLKYAERIFLYQHPAGFLTRKSSRCIAFPSCLSDCRFRQRCALVTYSDEIVQAFHLFPYYPFRSRRKRTAPNTLFN